MEAQQTRFAVYQRIMTAQLRHLRNGSDRNHLPAEPMGLENMLLTAQMESLCDQATDAAADSTARLYFVNDLLHK